MNIEKQDLSDSGKLRKKAELKLKQKQDKSDAPMEEMEIQKLLHELQVHQIELEMQNEELQQAYETAESALKKYTMLYEFAPLGFFSLDRDGTISELNYTGAEILHEKRFALIGTNFKIFIADDSKVVFDNFFNRIFTVEGKDVCELKLEYNDQPSRRVYMEGVVVGNDRQCLISVVDISALKKFIIN